MKHTKTKRVRHYCLVSRAILSPPCPLDNLLHNYYLLSFPAGTAISCYWCDPEYPQPLCLSPGPENITDCDTVPSTIPPAKYDACVRLSLEISFGQLTFNASILRCYYKVTERLISFLGSHFLIKAVQLSSLRPLLPELKPISVA